jgi:hypothetical protein
MAKRKRRAWTKKDIAELKAHSKSRTPVSKISKAMKRTQDSNREMAASSVANLAVRQGLKPPCSPRGRFSEQSKIRSGYKLEIVI